MRRLGALALVALASCSSKGSSTAPAPDAGSNDYDTSVYAECQFDDFTATIGSTTYTGEVHLTERAPPSTEVVGVLMGPPVQTGVEMRLPISGDVMGTTLTITIELTDAGRVNLNGALDQPLTACAGGIHGDAQGPGANQAGTFTASKPHRPPADASACEAAGADPLVCGIYVK